jgi:hypothetical protein
MEQQGHGTLIKKIVRKEKSTWILLRRVQKITLYALSKIRNVFAKGVRVAFCELAPDEEDFNIIDKKDFISFRTIGKELADTQSYRVFRIDTLNDLICVYVIRD